METGRLHQAAHAAGTAETGIVGSELAAGETEHQRVEYLPLSGDDPSLETLPMQDLA